MSLGFRLEQYTLKHSQAVLRVQARVDGDMDEILIFRGFSSSLVRPTAFDPDVPVIPDGAEIETIDILAGPYNPDQPRYLHQRLSWGEMQGFLEAAGL